VRTSWREKRGFDPEMSEDERATLLAGWKRAVERSRGCAGE
jgi:glycerol kinase